MTTGATSPLRNSNPGLEKVTHLLAVSSCKGGVGKSTVAVNLAYALASTGAKVGLFDADVYGPSLSTMVSPKDTVLYQEGDMIVPLEYEGIKLMSFGWVPTESGETGAAIMRGPMVTQVITQLLGNTAWGELDYLVIDYPPGTGDIQLTLSQVVKISAALIVTTPQQLSFVDVVKGIQMFDKMKVPTLGVVENMSYFICDKCDEKHYLFGQGSRDRLVKEFGMKHSFELPIQPELSADGDSGHPYMLSHPDAPVAKAFMEVAECVKAELAELKQGIPVLSYNVGQDLCLTLPDGSEHEFTPLALRLICRCAHCVDELTGIRKVTAETLDPDLYPTAILPTGNYAAAVEWSDGTKSCIFPFDTIIEELVKK
jgi:Mrp family chromosome partitioning ATPase/DUF971 family protein